MPIYVITYKNKGKPFPVCTTSGQLHASAALTPGKNQLPIRQVIEWDPVFICCFYTRLNICFSSRFRSLDIATRSVATAPITVCRTQLRIKTSFCMNALRRYSHSFLFVSMDRGKVRKISSRVPHSRAEN